MSAASASAAGGILLMLDLDAVFADVRAEAYVAMWLERALRVVAEEV